METAGQSANAGALAPIPANQRIEALDVVRGFALIGIFLMNIEFFNRAMSGIGEGMPFGLTGANWFASWFVSYFVQGKFWTIFSLLFGMGFAVMMVRAERAGREFKGVYLRRILALAVFGAAHYIFLWQGDILFSYAVAAGALMILLYGKWKYILIAMASVIGLGFIPGFDPLFAVAIGLAFVSLNILYMRVERRVNIRGLSLPMIAVVLLTGGALATIAAIVFWVLPNAPKDPRIMLTVLGPAFLTLGVLAARHHDPVEKRGVRLAVTIYVFSALMMTLFGAIQYFTPPEPDVPVATALAENAATPAVATKADASNPAKPLPSAEAKVTANVKPGDPASEKSIAADGKDEKKAGMKAEKQPEKTDAEKAAERKAERAKRLARHAEETRNDVRIMSQGHYPEAVELRARAFLDKAAGDAGFATILIAMFLLGVWFVRSGVMENTGAHLDFFRKLAWIGLPVGIGLGMIGSFITLSHIPGDRTDGFQLARGLSTLGNLPACLGYVGLVVLMLHSRTLFARIRILAPVGRMALTSYLMQSLICSIYFYGYAMGHWGMPRAEQMVFVAVVFAAQIVFSSWWLSRFRYGPMEWLWRGFTYRQTPKFRIDRMPGAELRPAM